MYRVWETTFVPRAALDAIFSKCLNNAPMLQSAAWESPQPSLGGKVVETKDIRQQREKPDLWECQSPRRAKNIHPEQPADNGRNKRKNVYNGRSRMNFVISKEALFMCNSINEMMPCRRFSTVV